MSDIRVKLDQQNTKVRVGQQNAVKVVSSVSGSAGGTAVISENVIGGIASVSSLYVSGVSTFVGLATFHNNVYVAGISTFVGLTTFQNNVYIGGNLYISNDLVFDEFIARNGTITNQFYVAGITTLGGNGSITRTGGDLYVSDNLYLPTGNIGLGTDNPTSALWIKGDGYFTGVVTASNFYVGDQLVGAGGSFNQLSVSGISSLNIVNIEQLYVSGVSTFVGVVTTGSDLYVGGDLYISDDLVFDNFTANSGNISNDLTVGQFVYPLGQPFGVAYFDPDSLLVSTGSTAVAISESNYIVSTDSSGIPTWASIIDGGVY